MARAIRSPSAHLGREVGMDRFVARQNIDHFRQQLAAERDAGKRAQLEGLLREAEAQLKAAEEAHANNKPR